MKNKLFKDENFQNGFTVLAMHHGKDGYIHLGDVSFEESNDKPSWMIAQWYSAHCLWNERKATEPHTITDGAVKTVKVNPKEHSVSMRLNARSVYEGKPHTEGMWPHLLLEQVPLCQYELLDESERKMYDASNKITLSLDIRMSEFVDTENKEGINACQYMAYFYMQHKYSERFVWFGVNLFDDRGATLTETYWNHDSVGTEMIYLISSEKTFGTLENTIYKSGCSKNGEWKEIRLDLSPYIDDVIELSNKDNIFGTNVTKEDFYFCGTNIGFEIHGNYDCTMEIKNYNLISE